jgi:FKBP-type peptidyl-prolyl cis-trans isomerase FklB
MQAAFQAQQKKDMEKQAAVAKKNLDAGQAFLEANKKKEGVVTLPSGLQYKVVTEGKGKQPKSTDTVVAHYRGTLINGTEFDSSYQRNEPATFPVGGVIKGWQEALPLMKEGAKWQVYIPSDLAYGPRGAGGDIGPNEVLIFDIELLSVKEAAADAESKKEEK